MNITFYPALDNFDHTIPFTPDEAKEYQRRMALGEAQPVRFLSRLVCVTSWEALNVWIVEHSWWLFNRNEAERLLWQLDDITHPDTRISVIKKRMKHLRAAEEAKTQMDRLECVK